MSYLLFNLIVTTYNFTLILHVAILVEDTIWLKRPADAGDWLNLAQFAVVALGHLILYVTNLRIPPQVLKHTMAVKTSACSAATVTSTSA